MRKLRKPLSWLLAVCMLFSLLPGTALAADPGSTTADTSTLTSWQDVFGVGADQHLSTKDIGRIWTDKTVSATDITPTGDIGNNVVISKDPNADFLVGLSALGSAATIVDKASVPVDTVFILDMSPKMGASDDKVYSMLSATESAVRALMDANPYNRVAVIGYSESAKVLLPLDHYQNGQNTSYFSYSPRGALTGGTVTAYGINSSNNTIQNTFDIRNWTGSGVDKYTQSGIYLGTQQLTGAKTSVEINGHSVGRVPQIILLSEGEPKDGDTRVTAPPTDTSNNIEKYVFGDGAGSDESRHAQSFAMMMTAAYMKGQVEDHYSSSASFITIGVDPGSADAPNLARLCVNPKEELSSNTHANDFNNYFNEYKTSTSVDIMRYGGGASRTDRVTFNDFPASVTSLAYNDAYYEVSDEGDSTAWESIFEEIANSILTSAPQYPTETPEGADGTGGEKGTLVFTDKLGAYMKVTGTPRLVFANQQFEGKTTDGGKTYIFEGSIDANEIYPGAASLEYMTLEVSTDQNGQQTLTWTIPAALLPLRTLTATSSTDSTGVTSHTIQQDRGAYPIRLFYSVDRDETVTFDQDDNEYLIAHSKDGTTSFYSNAWDAAAQDDAQYGTTTAVFTPAASNAFYHYTEDTPLYVLVDNVAGGNQKLLTHDEALDHLLQSAVIPERGTVVIDGTTYNIVRAQEAHKGQGAAYFYEHRYYQAQGTGDTGELDANLLTDYHLVLNPNALQGHVVDDAGGLSIQKGSAKLSRVSDGSADKTGNGTGTAVHYRHPVYNVDDTKVTVHLGNNGLRTEKTPTGTLTVKVNETTGSSVPSPEPTFTYKLELYNVSPEGTVNGKLDTQKAPVTVKIGDGPETPLNPDGTFQLQPGHTATVSGIPAGTAYQLTETAIAGYEDTYENSYPGYETPPQGRVVYDSTDDIAASVTVSHAYDPSQRSFTLTYNGNAVQGSVTNVPSAQPNITGGTQVTLAGGPTHSPVNGVAVAFIGWTATQNSNIYNINDTAPTPVASPYTVNADTTLYAAWGYDEDGNGEPDVTETQCTVTARVEGEGGSIDPTSETVNAGEDVEFTIDAKDGYALDTIQVNGKTEYTNDDITAPFEGTWTLENVQEAAEVVVTFGEDENDNGVPDDKEEPEEEQYTVTASSDSEEQGSIDPNEATVDAGDDLTFTIHAEDGCALDYITVNGDVVYSNNDPENAFTGSWTLEDIREDSEVVAYFGADEDEDGVPDEPSYWTIEASAGSGGGIDPEGDVFVPDGGDQRFDFDPDRGYEIDRVRVDGDSERVRSSYTFEEVTENHTIRVTFTETDEGGDDDDDDDDDGGITYLTITATAGEGGSISPDGRVQVAYDRNKSFIIQADEGYELADVLVDGRSVGAVGRYTFEKVHKNHTITAVFTASQKLNGVDRWLNTRDHIAYLSGYPDGTFGPDRNMTRAEVAQMFYALLNDQNVPATVSFSDVPDGAWYADAVETLASLGMFTGYPDGTFHPNSTITRAEFAAAALSFADMAPSARCSFPDVSAQDWFYPYVASAAEYGWIGGYPDGTFRPSGSITRAEVAVIVNHMLGRTPDQSFVDRSLDRLVSFSDLNSSHWAFYPIMEASNSHDHIKAGGSEQWTGINN